MSRLDQLETSPDTGRPERTVTVCTAGKLVRELEAVDAEFYEVEQELATERRKATAAADGETQGPPKALGERSPIPDLEKRSEALATKADGIRERMKAANVDLLLRAIEPHEWRTWVAAHPARDADDDVAGAARDSRWAASLCNIDAVVADLSKFIVEYDGEPASDRWWAFVSSKGAAGDLTKAASAVVGLHEQGVDAGKSRLRLHADLRSASS